MTNLKLRTAAQCDAEAICICIVDASVDATRSIADLPDVVGGIGAEIEFRQVVVAC